MADNKPIDERIKDQYEHRTRYYLPRRTYTIIRVDGKAFHTFTCGFKKPFDKGLMGAMNAAAIAMCQKIQGAEFAYVQSDEISVLLTDFKTIYRDAWFDGNIQKISSIAASIATAAFNWHIGEHLDQRTQALFDGRCFTIPDPFEVENYFIWRQQDWTRNSIQMGARALYSQTELHGKSTNELQELMYQKGVNWNDYSVRERRGGFVDNIPDIGSEHPNKTKWDIVEMPIFTRDRSFLRQRIPVFKEFVWPETKVEKA